jgi:hypothetical protein
MAAYGRERRVGGRLEGIFKVGMRGEQVERGEIEESQLR